MKPSLLTLLRWRAKTVNWNTAEDLAASLACEWLRYEDVPPRYRNAVTQFRHRRADARVRACRAYLRSLGW